MHELRFKNFVIEVDPSTTMVSLDDLWNARTDDKAMSPLVWLVQDKTQAYLKRLSQEVNLPPRRSRYTPVGGRTRNYTQAIEHMIDATEQRIFAAPEIATMYCKTLGGEVYSWAVAELGKLSDSDNASPPAVRELLKRFAVGEIGPVHIDIGTTHFDVITSFPPGGHGDHTDHGDIPGV